MRGQLRKVKNKLSKRRKDSVFDTSRTNSDESEITENPSFLGLPAEIRNEIYQYLALSTTLSLTAVSPRKKPPPVGLLVACKQTRKEYRAILLTQATCLLRITDYNFSNVIRVFERLHEDDLTLLKMNSNLWIYLQLGHVPSRDDRRLLRAWCDYRSDTVKGSPYFGSGQRIPADLIFQYNAKFLNTMRPPRPVSRYTNGYQMKLDLLKSHIRMATRLQSPQDETPNPELKRILDDLDDCANILEEFSTEISAVGD